MRKDHIARNVLSAVAAIALVAGPSVAFANEDVTPDTSAASATTQAAPEVVDIGDGSAGDGAVAGTPATTPEQPAAPAPQPADPVQKPATPIRGSAAGVAAPAVPAPPEQPAALAAKQSAGASTPVLRDPPPGKKVYVCKYSHTPGVGETLQTFNEVSVNALDDGFDGTFPWTFGDAHERSVAIGFVGNPVKTIDDCPDPEGPPELEEVQAPTLVVTPATCDLLLGLYAVSSVEHVSIEDADGASLPSRGALPTGKAIEVYAVADAGYVFANGSTKVHVGTIPVLIPPTGCDEPVLEPVELDPPTIEPGVCLPDGSVTSATVTTLVQEGVKGYRVRGIPVEPGETVTVPYDQQVWWNAVLVEGYEPADDTALEGVLGPIGEPVCDDPTEPVVDPTEPVVDPTEPVVDPSDGPTEPVAVPVADTPRPARTGGLASTGSDVRVALMAAALLVAAGGLALVARRRAA